ncbi:hypothetical protein CEXT_711941 [Caerostris extrusa]|uniref:Uncharacterized protein n=1 Tax=Caerostris extrusa TaxID=172846 RepID=A0AAV4PHJ2_CAEEX|nr:hypothetical protein CEXT_711941 [Caerostris extrusa]
MLGFPARLGQRRVVFSLFVGYRSWPGVCRQPLHQDSTACAIPNHCKHPWGSRMAVARNSRIILSLNISHQGQNWYVCIVPVDRPSVCPGPPLDPPRVRLKEVSGSASRCTNYIFESWDKNKNKPVAECHASSALLSEHSRSLEPARTSGYSHTAITITHQKPARAKILTA